VTFRDQFSKQAALYSQCRPGYPAELFDYLASIAPGHSVAWDCATGSGQAAVPLARFFRQVVVTDASMQQISHAVPHPAVSYRVAPADSSGLPSNSVDLVTVAQALHWFDTDDFYAEAKRVLVAGGALAAWGYGDPVMHEPALQAIVHDFNHGTMESYWPANRNVLLDCYRTLPFPFREIVPPHFELRLRWTLPELTGYFRTWSATARYVDERGADPVVEVELSLAKQWGNAMTRHLVTWPVYIRAGYSD
jgi:SAM-dependent methyltransferase